MNTGLLRKCSVTYLLLPNLLFSIGWFRLPYSFIIVAGYLYLLFLEFKKKDNSEKISLKDGIVVLIVACIWVFFSGVGGYTTQSIDWLAHNTKYYDLYQHEWPIYFSEVGRYATYYFGYYLVPAQLSKWAGMLLPILLVAWTLAGFFIGLLWIYILLNKNQVLLFFFLFLKGTGYWIHKLLNVSRILYVPSAPNFNPSIRSVFEHIRLVPNQLIPVLICCGMMVHGLINRKKIDDLFFAITLMFIWGIFPAISTLGIFGLLTVHRYVFEGGLRNLKWTNIVKNFIIPALIFVPTCVYFVSSDGAIVKGFLFSFEPRRTIIISYLIGAVPDMLLFFIVAHALKKESGSLPRWMINSLMVALFLFSIYRMGIYNDLFFRGTSPICIVIFIAILRGAGLAIENKKLPRFFLFYPAAVLMICFSLAHIVPLSHRLLRDNVVTNYFLGPRKKFASLPYDTYKNTYQALLKGYKDEAGARQYLAAENSWYQKYLSRNPHTKSDFKDSGRADQ